MKRMHNSECDVLCVGLATYDLFMEVEEHPPADIKVFATSLVECGGGPAANAALTVARLGGKAAFCGYLGRDIFGQKHRQELEAAGVDTSLVLSAEAPTPLAVILVKPNGDRTVVCHRQQTPNLQEVPASSGDPIQLLRPKGLLCDGHQPEVSLQLARLARKHGIPVVLDAGSWHAGTEALLPLTDYLVCSRRFAESVCPGCELHAVPEKLTRLCKRVFITMGEAGVVWQAEGETGHFPAYSVKAVDTTGAGDVFHGAFALGLTRDTILPGILALASAAAALCCQRMGARPGIPSEDEVERFLVAQSSA